MRAARKLSSVSTLALTAIAAMFILDVSPARAADTSCPELTASNPARAMMEGRLDEARQSLDRLKKDCANNNEIDFLAGMLALNATHYDEAIAHFRAILERNPDAARVRLELARAYFLKGDDTKASFHFRLAQAGNLPDPVNKNVETMLDRIRQRRNWSLSVSFNIAPDSNINAATNSSTVNIYGLPFRLDDNARAKSGVGVGFGVDGSYYFPVNDLMKWQVGGAVSHTSYSDIGLTDTTLAEYTGPRFTWSHNEVDLLAVATQRHYDGDWFSNSFGGRIQHKIDLTPRLTLKTTASAAQVTYKTVKGYDGPRFDVDVTGLYALTTSSFASLSVGAARQLAEYGINANRSWNVRAGYYRELPLDFSIYVEPGIARTEYDSRMSIFNATRRDWTKEVTFRVFNKKIEFAGFTPTLGYTYTSNDSNIPMYSYTRNRIEIGAVNRF